MLVSVVLATYNGEKYITEQINSILTQSLKPGEVIIRDDGSSDDTINIIRSIAGHSEIPFKIVEGRHNLGYAQNFIEAIKISSGKYIFLSDQDDIWFNEKISTVIKAFESDLQPLVIINNQKLVDSSLSTYGETTLSILYKQKRSSMDFVHGCCTAFHSKIKPIVLARPEGLAHDDWIHFIGQNCKSRLIIEKPLQLYRRHSAAVTSSQMNSPNPVFDTTQRSSILRSHAETLAVTTSLKMKLLWHLALKRELLKYESHQGLKKYIEIGMKHNQLMIIAIENRIFNIQNKNIFGILNSFLSGDYTFFKGAKTFIRDFISIIFCLKISEWFLRK